MNIHKRKKEQQASSVSIDKPLRKDRHKQAFLTVLLIAVLVFCGRYLFSNELGTTFYHLYSPKIEDTQAIRPVVLSDLHNREFGPGNVNLTEQIKNLKPDLIAIAGDMVNADDDNVNIVLSLCEKLTEIAPVYYSPGNHENHLLYEKELPLEQQLADRGAHVLVNRAETATIHGTLFQIGGLTTDPEGYDEYGKEFIREYEKSDGFKLLISHYPGLYYEALANTEIDLGICGHYHGGVVRIPGISGLYHGDTGFFPKYSGGMYDLPASTVFISRGMGGHSGFPRINNRPELAVIDINTRE